MTSIKWLKKQLEMRGGLKDIQINIETFNELCDIAEDINRLDIITAYDTGIKYRLEISGENFYNKKFKK
jgi:hypothetical protein